MELIDKQRRRITLKDVAERAGVSTNATSKVLNDTRSSAHVSDATRERILAAAREMGYQPNGLARSLQRQRTDIIGLYFEGELNTGIPFISAFINGAEFACQALGQSLLLLSSPEPQSTDQVFNRIASGLVDGVVMPHWSDHSLLARIKESGLPLVTYSQAHPDFVTIAIDELAGARGVMKHLKARGHRRLLYRDRLMEGEHRRQAFLKAAMEAGMEITPHPAGNDAGEIGAAERILFAKPRDERPTAVICWNDEFAYKLLAYCDSTGIKVPDDLAVVGFDGDYVYPAPPRKLTTVNVNWNNIGRTAIHTLIRLRDGEEVPMVNTLLIDLAVGETT